MTQLNLYISTCDPNLFVIKYFQYFISKYWGKDINIYILGFSRPKFNLNNNIKFISLSDKQNNGAKGWSNYLIDFFQSINDDYYMFGIDDFMVVRPVDHRILNTCMKNIKEDIGRIDLQPMQYTRPKRMFKYYNTIDDIDFYELKKKSLFRSTYALSGAFSIWKRKWFLKNIQKNMSPWDWEIKGSKNAENDTEKVICTWDNWAIRKMELLSNNAWPGIINTRGIRSEDVIEMSKLKEINDPIVDFLNIMDEKYYYGEFAGKNWELKILGL